MSLLIWTWRACSYVREFHMSPVACPCAAVYARFDLRRVRRGVWLLLARALAGLTDRPGKFVRLARVCDNRRITRGSEDNTYPHTLESAENLCRLGVLLDILDVVDQDGYLGEEGIVVCELVRLLGVASGLADVENRCNVWVHEPGNNMSSPGRVIRG